MLKFEEIDEARKLLELGESATLKDIKSAFRRLPHYHHPDKNDGVTKENEEMMKRLNRAYKLLLEYCENYKYGFRKEEVGRTYTVDDEMNKWRDKYSF